jgi:hypothetical protein
VNRQKRKNKKDNRKVGTSHTPIILATPEAEIRRKTDRQIVCETLSQKYPTHTHKKRLVERLKCLPNKHETLNSNASTTHKKIGKPNPF